MMTEERRRAIDEAATAVERAERLLFEAVDEARRAGATWQEIGDLFGVSRQAAHERWSL
jgi:hypothetical protein